MAVSRLTRAAAVALVAALALVPGCLPIRGETPAPGAFAESYALRPLLPLDERSEAVVYGTVDGVGDEMLRGVWHGAVYVAFPAYIDGTTAEVRVRAEVDTATEVYGDTGQAAKDRLLSFAGGEQVQVDVRREAGEVLRASRIAPVASLPSQPPSVKGVLDVVEGGRGSLRGTAAMTGVGAAQGTLRVVRQSAVRGIPLTVTFAIPWDSSTVYVTPSGRQRLSDAARETDPRAFLKPDVEVRFRRTPDGVVAEEVVQGAP